MGRVKRVNPKRVESAIRDAAKQGVELGYSEGSAAALEQLSSSWEHMARVANDLDDEAYVGDQVGGLLDLPALGTYDGELFVRHAGAVGGRTAWSRR